MFHLDAAGAERLRLRPTPTLVRQHGSLWVKHEDQCHGQYGGIFMRKLEWLLPAARDRGGELLTMGPVSSPWVLATALAGRQLGLRLHAVLWPAPDTPHVRAHARVLHARVEQIWRAPSQRLAPLVLAQAAISSRLLAWFPPWVLPAGGSSNLGDLGAVEVGLELGRQVQAGIVPEPSAVYVALGTGGTAAGVHAGLRLAGLRSELVAVEVMGRGATATARLRLRMMSLQGALRRLGAPSFALDGVRVVAAAPRGFGTVDETLRSGLRVAESIDVGVDPLVMARVFGVAGAEPGRERLVVHSGSTAPLGSLLADALDEVPPSLSPLLLAAEASSGSRGTA